MNPTKINILKNYSNYNFFIFPVIFFIFVVFDLINGDQNYILADNARSFLYGSLKFNGVLSDFKFQFKQCLNARFPFDVYSGRPLVSLFGECIETGIVKNINDYYVLRLFNLVLIFIIYCLYIYILRKYLSSNSNRIIIGFSFLFFITSPGTLFFFDLAISGSAAFISIILAFISLAFYLSKIRYKFYISGVFFILSLMIFPSLSLIIIPLILIKLFLIEERNIKFLFSLLALFFLFCITYFVIIRVLNFIFSNEIQDCLQCSLSYTSNINLNIFSYYPKFIFFIENIFLKKELIILEPILSKPFINNLIFFLIGILIIIFNLVERKDKSKFVIKSIFIYLISILISISVWMVSSVNWIVSYQIQGLYMLNSLYFLLLIKLTNSRLKLLCAMLLIFFSIYMSFNFKDLLKEQAINFHKENFIQNKQFNDYFSKHYDYNQNNHIAIIKTQKKNYNDEHIFGLFIYNLKKINSLGEKKENIKYLFCGNRPCITDEKLLKINLLTYKEYEIIDKKLFTYIIKL